MLYLFNTPIAAWAGVGKGECMSACPVPSVWNRQFPALEPAVPGFGTDSSRLWNRVVLKRGEAFSPTRYAVLSAICRIFVHQ